MRTTASALCVDLGLTDSIHLPSKCNTSTSTIFSTDGLPDLDGSFYSNTSNDSITCPALSPHHNLQLSSNSSNDTPPLSYTSSSKLDLSIKLEAKDSVTSPLALPPSDEKKTPKTTPTPAMTKAQNGDFPRPNAALDPLSERGDNPPTATDSTTTTSSTKISDENVDNNVVVRDGIDPEELVLGKFGYSKQQVITKTLQGNIFVAQHSGKANKRQVVIKKTSKKLHNEHVTVQNGRKFGIYENILKECIILKYLTENKNGLIMTSFTKYDNFFDDNDHYYLSMEHGGSDLFDFIIDAHALIAKKELKIKEWRKFTKYLFWQMIVVLKWMHNDMNICHLDISLENILCKNATFVKPQGSDMFTINPNVQIKICDFGLAEIFKADEAGNKSFECKKFCGKTNYKAPQVYAKKGTFDARKADIWSLGVVLFCMLVGSPPYNKPVESDQAYLYIKNGIVDQLLFQWERNHFITVKVLGLLHCMLSYDEDKRYLVDDVITHPWLSLYYNKYKTQMNKKSALQQQKNQRSKPKLPYYKLPNSVKSISNISQ